MVVLSCAYSAYPTHAVSLRAHRGFSPERSTSPVSVSLTHHHRHHHHDHLFVPEHFGGSTGYGHEDAGGHEALNQAFAEIIGAESTIVRSQVRLVLIYVSVILWGHHFGGSTGYGHEDAGGREALDQAFAEIVGAESAIVRSQIYVHTEDDGIGDGADQWSALSLFHLLLLSSLIFLPPSLFQK
ncbi:hypothetical protein ACSBR1_011664 [Camellia fascicularis]